MSEREIVLHASDYTTPCSHRPAENDKEKTFAEVLLLPSFPTSVRGTRRHVGAGRDGVGSL